MQMGKIVGGAVLVAATAAVWYWPEGRETAPAPEPVRPVRSALVTSSLAMPDLRFSGVAKASESRTLCFKQPGRIERIPVAKGQNVKRGEKLAWLLQEDFVNTLEKAKAVVERDRLTYARNKEALKKGGVSQQEVSVVEAQLKQSEAQFALAKRALEEATLVAPFDGVIADVPATELDMISSLTEPIVVVHDLSRVKVDVAIPETMVIAIKRYEHIENPGTSGRVTFDSFPDEAYPATFVEYAEAADRRNQTYLATYILDTPEDLRVLPGMSATVTIPGASYRMRGAEKVSHVPQAALGVDAAGGYFVWVLEPAAEKGVYAAHKKSVEVWSRTGDLVSVKEGLEPGVRVATAGVTLLTEGRLVTLAENE